jgi:hypothetical protein
VLVLELRPSRTAELCLPLSVPAVLLCFDLEQEGSTIDRSWKGIVRVMKRTQNGEATSVEQLMSNEDQLKILEMMLTNALK